MKYNAEIHHRPFDFAQGRHSIRLPYFDYSQPGFYFITICVKNMACQFGYVKNNKMRLNKLGKIIRQCWLDIPKHYPNVDLDEYIIMPNHLHGIIFAEFQSSVGAIHELPLQQPKIIRRKMLLPKIIGYFKMNSAKIINQYLHTPAVSFWQRNYYEHIIRNEKELEKIRQYIIGNPFNWEDDRNNPKNLKYQILESNLRWPY